MKRHPFCAAGSVGRCLFVVIGTCLLWGACSRPRPDTDAAQFEVLLHDGWQLQAASHVPEAAAVISEAGYSTTGWYTAAVPTTVMAALVANGVYPDPYFGRNLDAIPTTEFQHPWWYRTEFSLTEQQAANHPRLFFDGINYRADVWLNGVQVASHDLVIGAFRMFAFDVSKQARPGSNALAVQVYPPGAGDFTIGFVDWNPRPPDANMGLWREVRLRFSGAVSVDHPFVRSKIDVETFDNAELTVSTEVENHADREVVASLQARIGDISLEKQVRLAANEKREVGFSAEEFPELRVRNPRLWWPNGIGAPNLYDLELVASVEGAASDTRRTRFGIREVSDYTTAEGHRGYKVNGKPILIRGGGWVDDLFLTDDPQKVEAQIRYARHMNLNTIRLEGFWGNSQRMYDLADQYGLLVMVGWSCQWEWENYLGKPVDEFGGIKTPQEIALISQSLRDQVLWMRNHPSVFVWVLGSDMPPRPALEKSYLQQLAEVDPTRPTLSSCARATSEVSGPSAVKMNGPYDYVTPNYWYLDKSHGGAFGFNTETGPGPQPPPIDSIKKMIPEADLWPLGAVWNYHCGRNEFNNMDRYVNALNHRYGEARNAEDFARKSQVASYEAVRAMFESFAVNRPEATGVIQWMLNSAWPETYWQLYDWYLRPNGAFYGTKAACQPVNLVYNYGDHGVYLVNSTLQNRKDLTAKLTLLNLRSEEVFRKELVLGAVADSSKKVLDMPPLDAKSPVYFLDTRLVDGEGHRVAGNLYWLSTQRDVLDFEHTLWFVTPNKSFADFTALESLEKVAVSVEQQTSRQGDEGQTTVTLSNHTHKIAFFVELQLVKKDSGEMILPVFWDDNYITLLPGESRVLKGSWRAADTPPEAAEVRVECWNCR
jgi:exo-1,4-beta-D-glucosaminidase